VRSLLQVRTGQPARAIVVAEALLKYLRACVYVCVSRDVTCTRYTPDSTVLINIWRHEFSLGRHWCLSPTRRQVSFWNDTKPLPAVYVTISTVVPNVAIVANGYVIWKSVPAVYVIWVQEFWHVLKTCSIPAVMHSLWSIIEITWRYLFMIMWKLVQYWLFIQEVLCPGRWSMLNDVALSESSIFYLYLPSAVR